MPHLVLFGLDMMDGIGWDITKKIGTCICHKKVSLIHIIIGKNLVTLCIRIGTAFGRETGVTIATIM